MKEFWRNYRHRFVPWLALNLKSRRRREVSLTSDKIRPDSDLEDSILKITSVLHSEYLSSLRKCTQHLMSEELGFCVSLFPSKIKSGGTGVVLSKGTAKEGDLIAMYPGTVYRRFEPILLPSIGNSFILRCMDGMHVDGNHKSLSKLIYTSCVQRDSDRILEYIAADVSWMSPSTGLKVPWHIGQYVNNSIHSQSTNVAYQELDLNNFPTELHYLLPNIWYSGPQGRSLRVVVLVATRNINQGDEILSNYVTLVNDK